MEVMERKLENEIFCLRFELETIRDTLFHNSLERWVPDFVSIRIHNHHKARYELACKYAQNKRILDIACGSGYGSYLLAEEGKALEVTGIDINADAVHYGNLKYSHPRVSRSIGDAQSFSTENRFDIVISFETIEHLPKYSLFLECVQKALTPGGLFFVSTPIVSMTRTNCDNPYHVIEWSFQDFHKIVSAYFDIEGIYIQSVEIHEPWKWGVVGRVISKLENYWLNNGSENSSISPVIEKWNGQYNAKKIIGGYQILICKLKG